MYPKLRTARKNYEKEPGFPGDEHPLQPEQQVTSAPDLESDEIPSSSFAESTGWTDADMKVSGEVHDIEFYPGGRVLPGGAGRAPKGGAYVDKDTGEIYEYEADRYDDRDTAGDWEATRIETSTTEYMGGQLLPADLAKKYGAPRVRKGDTVFKRGMHSNK
ncbi:hypothetical protein RCL1_001024 [Eukaryota sp. TZLM3-RCL]